MNKTYRSIWNEALGAWVAASEAVSSRGKASGSKRSLATAALVLLAGIAMPVHAQYSAGGGTASAPNAIVFLPDASAPMPNATALLPLATLSRPMATVSSAKADAASPIARP